MKQTKHKHDSKEEQCLVDQSPACTIVDDETIEHLSKSPMFEYQFHYTVDELQWCHHSSTLIEQKVYLIYHQIQDVQNITNDEFKMWMDALLFYICVVAYRVFQPHTRNIAQKENSFFVTFFIKRHGASIQGCSSFWKHVQSQGFNLAFVNDSISAFVLLWMKLCLSSEYIKVKNCKHMEMYKNHVVVLYQFAQSSMKTVGSFFYRLRHPDANCMFEECITFADSVAFDFESRVMLNKCKICPCCHKKIVKNNKHK